MSERKVSFLRGLLQDNICHVSNEPFYTDLLLPIEMIEWLIEQSERVQKLEDVLDQDARQEVIESMYEENKRLREVLFAIEDFDIELGDSRDDMQSKLSQIKFIKDKALEESE